MRTLHAYILRELLKTFALTLVALTALFTMGGGLYNVLRQEGIGAADLFRFIPLLLPIVVTLTMPVAALFAATMVYGRLSADNEINACRAVGINVHWLFLPGVLLSVFVAVFTLLFSDLVVPDFVHRIDRQARANLRDIAYQKMQVAGHVKYERGGDRFLVTARRAWLPLTADLVEQKLPTEAGIAYLALDEPVFLQVDDRDGLVRYAAARRGLAQFDTRALPPADAARADGDAADPARSGPNPVVVTLYVDRGRDFDLRGRSVHVQQQRIGPIRVPFEFMRKSSMVNLRTLLRWRQRPWEADRLRPQVREFLADLTHERFLRYCAERLVARQPIILLDDEGAAWHVTAAGWEDHRRGLLLTDARVTRPGANADRPLYYEAPRAVFSPRTAVAGLWLGPQPLDADALTVSLQLLEAAGRRVVEHHPRASDYARGRTDFRSLLPDTLRVPADVRTLVTRHDEALVFAPDADLPLGPRLAAQRAEMLDKCAEQRRKAASVIHFRLGTSASVPVTVLMAAALGVILRGARALAAFGVSCVPLGGVALLMVMSRSLAEKPATETAGLALIWIGLVLVAVADGLIVRLGVRR